MTSIRFPGVFGSRRVYRKYVFEHPAKIIGILKACTLRHLCNGQNPQHAGIINNFTTAILGKEPLFVSGTGGLAGVELMNAIEYSGWNGGIRVQLPVDEEAYLQALTEHRKTSHLKPECDDVFNTAGSYGSK